MSKRRSTWDRVYSYCILALLLSTTLWSQQKGISPLSVSESTASGETYAVVVGISNYQDPGITDLRFADRDAAAFAQYLRSPAGGQLDEQHLKVLFNEEATTARIAAAFDWLIEQVGENDRAWIYFSGHGDVETKTMFQLGYLLSWDSPPQTYVAGAFPVQYLQAVITTLSTENKARVLLITDACRSGKLAGNQVNGTSLTGANLSRQFANETKILSCQPDEYSLEGEQWGGGRGVFSYHLVEGLYGLADSNQDGEVSLMEIGRYLEDHVYTETAPQHQLPMTVGTRTEKVTAVDAGMLEKIKKEKSAQLELFAATDSRGLEESVLAAASESDRQLYDRFKLAIAEKRFLCTNGNCAESLYRELLQKPALSDLHSSMTRQYAAALQDDAQQVLNNWLKTDVQELGQTQNRQLEKYRIYPDLLKRASELLGEEHYMYDNLKAREAYFQAYVLGLALEMEDLLAAEAVLDQYRKALQWQDDLPHVYLEMARVFGEYLGQADSARHYAMSAAKLVPSWVLPYSDLAFMLANRFGHYEEARNLLQDGLKIDNQSALLLNNLGLVFFFQENFPEAERFLLKAIEQKHDYRSPYNNLGLVYTKTGDTKKAQEMLTTAIELSPKDANKGYYNLACLWALNGKARKAFDHLEKALQTGFSDYDFLQQDPDLELLRSRSAWNELMKTYFPEERQH